jgi:cation diffusion facilitator family transporter
MTIPFSHNDSGPTGVAPHCGDDFSADEGCFLRVPPDHALPISSTDTSGFRLLVTLGINFVIPVVQIIGGVMANSIALISDAVHNFSDFIAILISYIALRIGRKGVSTRHTFGFQRAEILGALLNVAILFCAVIFIVYEAFWRLWQPEPVSGGLVMILAGVGIAGNGFSALLLYRDSRNNLNIRGAFLHMIGDFLTSLMVLISGAVLLWRPWYWLDPLLSFLIAIFILKNCWTVLTEAVAILMNATPRELDLPEIQKFLESRPEIISAHYLHAWNLGNCGIAFTCHLTVADRLVSDTEILAEKIRHALFRQFGIDHPVFQFETVTCGNGNMLCELSGQEQPPKTPSGGLSSPAPVYRKNGYRIFGWTSRIILGLIFIAAGIPKILYPAEFAAAVYNYRILPDALVNIVALALPWVEVLVGGMLIVGVWMPGAVMIYTLLMLVFITALGYNVARGLDIHCGCFSPTSGELISFWTITRDVAILLMSLYLFFAVWVKKIFLPYSRS